jgi:hypothetical protein
MDDFQVYDTVMITVSNGTEKEFAIIEEFDFEQKHYIVVSPVEDNQVQEGLYIYRAVVSGEEMEVSRIEDAEEFEKVSAYYEAM